jgi:hypothetical protein
VEAWAAVGGDVAHTLSPPGLLGPTIAEIAGDRSPLDPVLIEIHIGGGGERDVRRGGGAVG